MKEGLKHEKLLYLNAEIASKKYLQKLSEMEKDYNSFTSLVNKKKRIKSICKYPKDRILEKAQLEFLRHINGRILNTEKREKKITVSITTFPGRIKKAPAAIATMLRQTMMPDKVILWLGEDVFPDRLLPKIYRKLEMAGVEIRFIKDIGVHTRWYYGIKENPDDIVIIADDDVMYKEFVIERLYNSYKRYPNCVSALSFLNMQFTDDCKLMKYEDWYSPMNVKKVPSYRFMAVESGGVLYPPHILPEEAFNKEVFLKITPKQDDLWLKCMEVINGIKVAPAQINSILHSTVIRGTQRGLALGISNMIENGNDVQMNNILEKYNDFRRDYLLTEIMAYDLDI